MNVGFIADERIWWIPDIPFAALASILRRMAGDSESAALLADGIEIAIETGARTYVMDDRDQPGFRLALEAWLEQQPDSPDWAVRLRDIS